MNAILFSVAVLLSFSAAHAARESKVTCTVFNLAQAEACMAREANAQPSEEGPNDGAASRRVDLLSTLLQFAEAPDNSIEITNDADYVGFIITYGDEFHIIYYAINRGRNTKPQVVYDLNIGDIPAFFKKEHDLRAGLFFLGLDGKKRFSSAHSDVSERLAELKRQN